jgi:hypothetical protein
MNKSRKVYIRKNGGPKIKPISFIHVGQNDIKCNWMASHVGWVERFLRNPTTIQALKFNNLLISLPIPISFFEMLAIIIKFNASFPHRESRGARHSAGDP